MGKLKDMFLYYDRVRYCCCIENDPWHPDPWMANDSHEILNQTIPINRVLEKGYTIGLDEDDAFVAFYRRYKAWLSEKFLDESFLFGERYVDCFLLKNRKSWKTNDFKAVFPSDTFNTLFFAQTFSSFASRKLKEWRYYADPKPEQAELLVAHKMYYGVLLILRLIGYRIDADINEEKAVLDSLLLDAVLARFTDLT